MLVSSRGEKIARPPKHWDGIFEATYRVKCPQMSSGDENCLVVNVFTPEHGTSLPVLVHVHSGEFQSGWGFHKPPERLLNENIVIVTFNYRLGAFGFLCIGTPEAYGNVGLTDQVAVLNWVKTNIANFGGNPMHITLYGTEAGAISVQILLLSRLADGLFHKAILEEGSILSPQSICYDPLYRAIDVAIKLGYTGPEEPPPLVNFYKSLPATNLSSVTEEFLPCIEKSTYNTYNILDTEPLEIFNNGTFMKVPMLITYTDYFIKHSFFDRVPDNFDNLLPNNLEFDNYEIKHRIGQLVKEFYFNDNSENTSQKFANYIQDITVEYPIVKSAQLHAAKNLQPVFLMKLLKNTQSKINLPNGFGNIMNFIFADEDLDHSIEVIQDTLVKFWSNFIKLSDPTPLKTSLTPVIWEPVSAEGLNSKTEISQLSQLLYRRSPIMSTTYFNQHLILWDRIYANFYKPHKALN